MHAFFKPVLLILFVVFLFFYILINSNTVESRSEVVVLSTGMPQQRTSHVFHWDRFGAYIKNTPARIKNYFSGTN